MTIPTITLLPTPPAIGDDVATFNSRTDAFLPAMADAVPEMNTSFAAIDQALLDAIAAATNSTLGTSTTSLAIGTGSKVFTTQASKNWAVGSWLMLASASGPSNYMLGQVTAYSGTSLTVNVPSGGTSGSGTKTDWVISLSGPKGVDGGGYTLISTASPSAVASVVFSLPSTYNNLLIVVEGLSPASGTPNLQIEFSDNGGTNYDTATAVSGSLTAASDGLYGGIVVFGYRKNAFHSSSGLGVANSNRTAGGGSLSSQFHRLSGGADTVRLTWSTAVNFDGGTVTAWGI